MLSKEESIRLLTSGREGISEWNRLRQNREWCPDLQGVTLRQEDLNKADLRNANLQDAEIDKTSFDLANLSGANLHNAVLTNVTMVNAILSSADLSRVRMSKSDLTFARLDGVRMFGAEFMSTSFVGVDASRATLIVTTFRSCELTCARLREAELTGVTFDLVTLTDTDFKDAVFNGCLFGRTRLDVAPDLSAAAFAGPNTIGVDSLSMSLGGISREFLQGSGLADWEVLNAKLYDPNLTASEVANIQDDVFRLRTTGPFFHGGVFISHSNGDDDIGLADKLYVRLKREGVPCWLDSHDMVAGDLNKQVMDQIRRLDIVLLILSKRSIDSDWVEYELKLAREKEKDEHRDVLCPVTLDDAWRSKPKDVLWSQLWKKNVLDFSKWKTTTFESKFQKLIKGLKIYYTKKPEDPS